MQAVKGHLHELIESSQNAELLQVLSDILEQNENRTALWNGLSNEQKVRTIAAEESATYPENQVTHKDMTKGQKKWLK